MNTILTIPQARNLTCPRLACGPLVPSSPGCGEYADGWEVECVNVVDARGGRHTYARAIRIELDGTVTAQGLLRKAGWRAQSDAKGPVTSGDQLNADFRAARISWVTKQWDLEPAVGQTRDGYVVTLWLTRGSPRTRKPGFYWATVARNFETLLHARGGAPNSGRAKSAALWSIRDAIARHRRATLEGGAL